MAYDLRKLLLNRVVFFLAVLLGSTLIGAGIGLLAYLAAWAFIPWLSESQRIFMLFSFMLIGFIIGLYAAVQDLVRNWGYVSTLKAVSRREESPHIEHKH